MLLRFLHLGMQCRIIKIKKYKEIVKLLWLYYLQSKIKKKRSNPTFCKRKSSYLQAGLQADNAGLVFVF